MQMQRVSSSYVIDDATNTITLTYVCVEKKQSKVEEILFDGVLQVPESTIKKVLNTKVQSLFNTGNFKQSTIDQDRKDIELAYQQLGFIDAKVTDVLYEEIEQDKPLVKKLSITFVIEEGDKWFLDDIYIEGTQFSVMKISKKVITLNLEVY